MARIAGVNIPTQKKLGVALTYVYGIGDKISKDVRSQEAEIKNISDVISSSFLVEGDLRREVSGNIKRLKDLGTYRGVRHRKNLPCRGQRTHTNARTKKGKAIAIAGKKKVTK